MSKKKDKSLIKKGRKKIKTNLLRRQLLRVKVRDDGHLGGLVRLSVKGGGREGERVSEVGAGDEREEVETNVAVATRFFHVFSPLRRQKQTLNAALKNEPSRPSDATPAAAALLLLPPPPLCGEGGGRAAEEEENQRLLCCDCCDADDDADDGALASFFVSSSGAAAAASVGVTGLLPGARSPTPSAPSSSSSLLASMERRE